jgi:hypothetical protein
MEGRDQKCPNGHHEGDPSDGPPRRISVTDGISEKSAPNTRPRTAKTMMLLPPSPLVFDEYLARSVAVSFVSTDLCKDLESDQRSSEATSGGAPGRVRTCLTPRGQRPETILSSENSSLELVGTRCYCAQNVLTVCSRRSPPRTPEIVVNDASRVRCTPHFV